ncbi:MAG TPA: PIG-L family deacetylase [Micromonosporaceae bacterium]
MSPHLDDAVLSAGAALYEWALEGHDVVVHTMLAGIAEPPFSPLARGLHLVCRLRQDPVGVRRQEDVTALGRVGATVQHGVFLDSIYRRTGDGWVFGKLQQLTEPYEDAAFSARLTRSVTALLTWAPDLVLTAAAIGSNVDHVLVRDAVLNAAKADGVQVKLWQDMPYAARTDHMPALPPHASIGAVEARPMSVDGWSAKCDAVACYTSQVPMLWPRQPDFRTALEAHGRIESFWPVSFDR